MAAFQKMISDKLASIFRDAQAENDWAACWQRVSQFVLAEKERSFKNGIRWAKSHRIGWFPVRDQAEASNDSVVIEEVEVQ